MKSEQREYVIEVASKMFVSDGVKSVTMSDIANATSISKRTLYEEFKDKEELLYLATMHYSDQRTKIDQEIVNSSPNILVGMLSVTDDVMRNSEVNWKLYRGVKASYPSVHRRLFERQAINIEQLIERLTRGVEEGLVSPRANLRLSVTTLFYMASNLVHHDGEIVLLDGATAKDAFWEFSVNFMRGIATTRGMEIIDEYIENRDRR